MALPNLSGSNIQDTFQRVLQTDGTTIYDGTGSAWLTDVNGNAPDQNGVVRYNSSGKLIADSGWTFGTHNGNASIMHLQANEINFNASTGINLVGNISASGTIQASDIVNHSNTTSGLRLNPASTDVLSNLIVSGSITALGDISESGTIHSLRYIEAGTNISSIYATIASPSFTGNITASGNISASGDLFFNNIDGGTF